MANDMEEAERAYMLAEERFVAGDLAGALRSARNSKRLFASLPTLQNAAAAYEVHAAAAAAARGGKMSWYAVLGLRQDAAVVTHEDVKRQYRRLCLVLHPDKNPSAAADGAFKLLHQAWEALSTRHPPGRPTPSVSATKPSKKAPPPPRPRAPPCRERRKTGGSQRRPPSPEWSSFGFTAPPEPDGSTFDFRAWREAYARANGAIYCGHCDTESAAEGGAGHGKSGTGGRCHSCGARSSPVGPMFTCQAACPGCGERLSSPVSVGVCCGYVATVHVRSRESATAF
nr:unnamed protein product [Digitaria exilis]